MLFAAAVRVNLLRPLEPDMGGGGGGGLEAWISALSGLWFGSEEASVGITVENEQTVLEMEDPSIGTVHQ